VIKTAKAVVSIANDYECIGIGDSSLLRFLERMVGKQSIGAYITHQASLFAVYLIYQAKKYIDGCGGDTQVSVLWPSGTRDIRDGYSKDLEKEAL
jgi:hypothetical protein